MTTFVFKSPDGKEYEVEGPEGATEAQAFQMLQSQLGTTQAPPVAQPAQPEARGYGPARSVLQGMTFGFADEAGAGAAALAAKAGGDKKPISDIYREMKDAYNVEQGQYEKAHPVESTALQIGGGLATAWATARAAAGSAAAAAAGRFIAAHPVIGGGLAGGLAGAGMANRMEDVPLQAGIGTATGAGTGLLMRGLFGRTAESAKGATPGLVGRLVSSARGLRGPEQASVQQVGKDLRASGMTPQEAGSELNRLGPQSSLSDISDNLQRTARTVYTQKGSGAEIARDALESRSIGGPQRVVADLKAITGKDTNFYETVRNVITTRKAEAAPLYAEADKARVPEESVVTLYRQLLDKSKDAEGTPLGRTLKNFAGMLKSGSGYKTNLRQLHIVKGEMRDVVSNLYRNGEGNKAQELDGMLKLLSNSNGTGILEKSSDAYRQANLIFSDKSSVIKALESGRKVLNADADEVVDSISKLSAAEKDAYIQGSVKAIRDKILSGNKFSNDLVRERLRNAFPDEEAFKTFLASVEREKTFAGTKGFVLGGSQTANKASDVMKSALEASSIVQEAIRWNPVYAAFNAVKYVLNRHNIPERLHEPLAKYLTTPEGSRKAVDVLIKQGVGNPKPLLDQIRVAVIAAAPQSAPQAQGNQ